MRLRLLTVTLFITFSMNCQTLQITDQYVFGGASQESADYGVQMGGELILAGGSNSGVTGDKTSINYGGEDYWIISLDESRNILWQNSFGGGSNDMLVKLIKTYDGNLLVAGWSSSGANGNKTAPNIGGSDFWVVKIDNLGNEIWQRTYGGSGDDYIVDIVEFTDGSVVLVGSSDSPISGDKTEDSFGTLDYWIVKIDENGNVLWDKTIGGSLNDGVSSIAVDENESIYLSGTSESPISGYKTEASFNGSSDIWVVKLNNNGDFLWDKTIGGNEDEMGRDIIYSNNIIYVVNNSRSGSSGTKTDTLRGVWDFWIVKLDNNGNILADKTFGGEGVDQVINTRLMSTGELILAGVSDSQVSGEVAVPTINNSTDFWVLVVDSSDLSLISQFMYGGDQTEVLPNILELENNSLLLFGGSDSGVSGDKNEPSKGGYDFWLLELSTDLSVSNNFKGKPLSIYPNPTSTVFNVSNLSTEENYDLVIFDNMGKTVFQSTIIATNNSVDVNSLSSGMYTVQLFDGKRRYISKLVVE